MLDVEHLLLVLLEQPSEAIHDLLETLEVDTDVLLGRLDEALQTSRRPSIAARPKANQIYVSPYFNRALRMASQLAENRGDGHIFAEHMLLAVLKTRKPYLRRLLKETGAPYSEALKAMYNKVDPEVMGR